MAISTVKVSSKNVKNYRVDVTASHPIVIDQPKGFGGGDEGPNPLEVFLSGLSACVCTLGRIIAFQKKINLHSIEVETVGDIDKDFLMGITTEGRAGFTQIRTFVKIDADLTDKEKEEFLQEIERRCPIADNITNITVSSAELIF